MARCLQMGHGGGSTRVAAGGWEEERDVRCERPDLGGRQDVSG